MKVEKITKALQNRLQQELPSWKSHRKMATQIHKNARIKPPSITRKAGVLILLFAHQNEIYLPLILRTTYNGVHSGQMAFPGGKVEPTDEDIIATALRETYEEIGVEVSREQVIGILSDLYIPVSNITVTPVLAIIRDRPGYTLDITEVAGITEVPIQALRDPDNHGFTQVSVINGVPLEAPVFHVNDRYTVWGATAMMLSELLDIFEELD
ncbi:MAG: NUDIX hydrolase [Cyclobacteriaceae bacterium]